MSYNRQTTSDVTIDDFSAGLITSLSPFGFPINGTPDCMNVESAFRRKSLRKRYGRTKINTSALAQLNGNGLHFHKPINGEGALVIHNGTVLYKMPGFSGTATSIRTGLPDDVSMMVSYAANESGDRKNFLVLACKTPHPLLKWDGDEAQADVFSGDSGTPKARQLTVFEDRLLACDIDGEPDRVRYTDANGLTFPAANNFDLPTTDGEGCTGFGFLRTQFVFKPSHIFQLTFTGGTPLFTTREVSPRIGTVSPKTITNIQLDLGRGKEEVMIFLGSDKNIYIFDGYTPRVISDIIKDDNGQADAFLRAINDASLEDAFSVNNQEEQYVDFYLGVNGTSTNDTRFRFDYSGNGAFWPADNQTIRSGTMAVTKDGDRRYVVSDYSGFILEQDKGTDDAGTAITTKWLSALIAQFAPYAEKIKAVTIYARGLANKSLTVKYRFDKENSFVTPDTGIDLGTQSNVDGGADDFLGTFTLNTDLLGGVEYITNDLEASFTTTNMEIQISDSLQIDPWEVYRIQVTYTPIHRYLAGGENGR